MQEIRIDANDAGRRLDRFLRKYFRKASLSEIYKIIRKDAKVDGKRRNESYMLQEGEVLTLYLSDELITKFTGASEVRTQAAKNRVKKQFNIVFEDEQVLIADKPFGLLTHGDSTEKKNHLANQVKDYLIEKGDYNPRNEKIFSPAPANRIDRNTTGLVLFGKTSEALKDLNRIIRENLVSKYYLTIVSGSLEDEQVLEGALVKDHRSNKVRIVKTSDGRHKPVMLEDKMSQEGELDIKTIVRPLEQLEFNYRGKSYPATLVEVELVTGRSHQIRAHLASINHPIIGDSKYAKKEALELNRVLNSRTGLSTQLLHAYRLQFAEQLGDGALEYLEGKSFVAKLPERFEEILAKMGSMTQF